MKILKNIKEILTMTATRNKPLLHYDLGDLYSSNTNTQKPYFSYGEEYILTREQIRHMNKPNKNSGYYKLVFIKNRTKNKRIKKKLEKKINNYIIDAINSIPNIQAILNSPLSKNNDQVSNPFADLSKYKIY